jgi:hypothetical protein
MKTPFSLDVSSGDILPERMGRNLKAREAGLEPATF